MSSPIFINSIPIKNINFVDNAENTIVSNGINEEFIGISTVKIGQDEILCEHTESDVVKCNVVMDDMQYENIPFRLIVDKKSKPFITLNKNSLINPTYKIEPANIIEEVTDIIEQSSFIDTESLDILHEEISKRELTIEKLREEIQNFKIKQEENKQIEEEKVIDYLNEKVNKALSDFKENAKTLIKDYVSNVDITERQIKDQIKNQLKELEEKVLNPNSYEGNKLMLNAIKEIILESDTQEGGTINKFKDQLLEDIRKASEQQLRNHTRQMQRYAEMVSGGGSVAVQFANGGTMSGNLNVNAQYLSGGKDLIDVFSAKYIVKSENNEILEPIDNALIFEPVSNILIFQYSNFEVGKTINISFSAHHPGTLRHFLPQPSYISGPAGESNTFFTHGGKITKLRITNINGTYIGETELIDTTEPQIVRPSGNALLLEDDTFLLLESGGALLLE